MTEPKPLVLKNARYHGCKKETKFVSLGSHINVVIVYPICYGNSTRFKQQRSVGCVHRKEFFMKRMVNWLWRLDQDYLKIILKKKLKSGK